MTTERTADLLENFVEEKIRYAPESITGIKNMVPFFRTTESIMETYSGACSARALVAYMILRNLGYEAYMATSLVHTHVWTIIRHNGKDIPLLLYRKDIEPSVIFDENEAQWNSLGYELKKMFFKGVVIYSSGEMGSRKSMIDHLPLLLLFAFPAIWAIIILLFKQKITKISYYFLFLLGAVVFAFIIGGGSLK